MNLELRDVVAALDRWARAQLCGAVRDAWPMPGNAGLSFGFDVVDADALTTPLVIRFAPPGVRRRGNTDVLRQVPLLSALERERIPVASVVWSTDDPSWFGTDALVQHRFDAQPLHMTEGRLSVEPRPERNGPYLTAAAQSLARIHAVEWRRALADWQAPGALTDDLEHWSSVLSRSDEAGWKAAGQQLRRRLAESVPPPPRPGLVHGDFQTNNVLYRPGAEVVAVVDWELAAIGAQPLDLAWLIMFSNRDCWADDYARRMLVACDPRQLRDAYADAGGTQIDDLDWFLAYGCFRFASISAYNIRLHRTGARPDPSWEGRARSVERLFEFGRELLR